MSRFTTDPPMTISQGLFSDLTSELAAEMLVHLGATYEASLGSGQS